MSHLLHPELFESIPFNGETTARLIDARADDIAAHDIAAGGITVAVRCRNEATDLGSLLADVHKQQFNGGVEVIVVDNDSTDESADVARSYGARVVTLPRDEFTYTKSMNLCMEQASFDRVFLSVGHALLSNDQTLSAGALQFDTNPSLGGMYSKVLPSFNASRIEKALAMTNAMYASEPRRITKASMGVMVATGAFFSREAWNELGRFDERYQSGGEDTALAAKMLDVGISVIEEPALAVHHSHGLGFVDTAKQWAHWFRTVKAPQNLDMDELLARRPDLRAKYDTDA